MTKNHTTREAPRSGIVSAHFFPQLTRSWISPARGSLNTESAVSGASPS
jgi:hypothetical protein